MDLLILIVASLVLLSLLYVFYRVLLRIEHALQDMHAAHRSTAEWSRSTATQAMQVKANVIYLTESLEQRFGHGDELHRQTLLRQVRLEHLASQVTPIEAITPVTPAPPPWIGNQAMQEMRRQARERWQ